MELTITVLGWLFCVWAYIFGHHVGLRQGQKQNKHIAEMAEHLVKQVRVASTYNKVDQIVDAVEQDGYGGREILTDDMEVAWLEAKERELSQTDWRTPEERARTEVEQW